MSCGKYLTKQFFVVMLTHLYLTKLQFYHFLYKDNLEAHKKGKELLKIIADVTKSDFRLFVEALYEHNDQHINDMYFHSFCGKQWCIQ